jgi:GntR family transcriptional regulator/MocR family aminotransferase
MTTLHLSVDRNIGVPIHRQVYEALRRAILDGRLRPGQRIPSSRSLAMDIGVSRLPVLSAYEQLLHEGYLVGRTGSGTFVSEAVPDDLLHPIATTGRASSRRVSRVAATRNAADRPARSSWNFPVVPFQGGLPALDLFPFATWAKLVARHVRAESPERIAYTDPAGLMALRAAIAEHLRSARAVRCEAEQVLIVPGSQAALRVTAAALLEPGDRVAIEEPGYFGVHRALRAAGAEIVPVPVDEDGLDVAALRRRGGPIRAVYVTPSHQYPLGMTMSAARRFALLEWASRQQAWILEDDYDSEFRYVSRPVGALQGMDARDRVIYIGTFSKAFCPAVRLGYVIVPPALWSQFLQARTAFDFFTPTLYQRALAEFLRAGHFARHLRRMRSAYLERRDALLSGVARHCGDMLRVHNSDAGLHVAALLRDDIGDQDVIARLSRRGLAAISLSNCYVGSARRQGLLLGFGCTGPERLLEATKVLGEVLHSY